jgi:DnaJ-domain-containing protein 1
MRSSDFLFRLIKALSKGDRRNLKLFGKLQDGDKKYLQLFDAIDAQEEYDEAALLEQFKEERFAKQFSVAKNYLYNYILRTLHVFHHDAHADLTVLLHQIEILMGKNLYDQAQKLVRKAKHMATSQERFQEMLYLLDHERKILNYMERSKEYVAFIGEIEAQEHQVVAQLSNLLAHQHVWDEVYVLTQKGQTIKGSKELDKLEELLQRPILQDPQMALSVRARIKQVATLTAVSYHRREIEKALAYNAELIELYRNHDHIRLENNIRYINAVSDYGIYSHLLGRKPQAMQTLDKLKAIETYSTEEKVRVFETYFVFKIGLSIELGDIQAGLDAIKCYEEEASSLDGQIRKSVELGIYYVIAYFYLTAGKAEAALQWVNRLLNEPRTELRLDLQCAARMLNVLIHFELGNYDLLEYMMKSTVRFLTNRNRFTEVDRTALRHLKQLTNCGPGENIVAGYQEFLADLQELLKDDFGKHSMNVLNLEAWLQAKISNRLMAEIFQIDSHRERSR